jgi:hypothetical protein
MATSGISETDADRVADPRDTGFDDSAPLSKVRRLEAKELGNRRMAKALGMSIGRVRHARIRARLIGATEPPMPHPSGALQRYDAARAALAECRRVDEVLAIKDDAERLKLYARQAKDRIMMADAAEIQFRATRQLGALLVAARGAGQIAKGRPKANGSGEDPIFGAPATLAPVRVRLGEAGIDKKLADKARKSAALTEHAFEAVVEDLRARVIAGRALVIEAEPPPINGARAVMANRAEPDDSLNFFPTPPWATRALMERVLPVLDVHCLGSTWEPACGEGHMAEVLREYCSTVIASDVFAYGYGDVSDFLAVKAPPLSDSMTDPPRCDWIIINPPFAEDAEFGDKATAFVLRALGTTRVGVAMFVRTQWAGEGVNRYERIFRPHPPTLCAFFTERVNLCKGRWNPDGDTATAYCSLVWVKDRAPLPPFWIPPGCRETLTRADDTERFTANPVRRRLTREIGAQSAAAGDGAGASA